MKIGLMTAIFCDHLNLGQNLSCKISATCMWELYRYNGLLFCYNGLLIRYNGLLIRYSGLPFRYNGLLICYNCTILVITVY